jgi:hypothetical protein
VPAAPGAPFDAAPGADGVPAAVCALASCGEPDPDAPGAEVVAARVGSLPGAAAPGALPTEPEPVDGRPATGPLALESAVFMVPVAASAPVSETMIQAAPPMAATEPAVVTAVTA